MSVTKGESVTAVTLPFVRPQKRKWFIAEVVILHVVAFAATMMVNNCLAKKSQARCSIKDLVAFQPISENPLLGPSASTLELMGALTRYVIKDHQLWRLFTSPCLHAGLFHLILNLSSVLMIGAHLESEFDSASVAIIYILSALTGSSLATLFLQDRPIVASSGALFGLLGATLSRAVRNWIYSKKSTTVFVFIIMSNVLFGLMPYVSNFLNIGGFVCGFLAGFVLLIKPQVGQRYQARGGTFDNKTKLKFVLFLILSSLILAAIAQQDPQKPTRFFEESAIQREHAKSEAINRRIYNQLKRAATATETTQSYSSDPSTQSYLSDPSKVTVIICSVVIGGFMLLVFIRKVKLI